MPAADRVGTLQRISVLSREFEGIVAVQTAMIGFAAVLSCGAVVSVAVALRDRAPGPGARSAQSARPF
ncbi:hypothetical protein [Streptomyces sp. NPDC093261]|uniref:hypothetical protein n=1 Tax=Streptomyces sp. NPDC093261 TaxID=3366037 RepID=UPI003800B1E0